MILETPIETDMLDGFEAGFKKRAKMDVDLIKLHIYCQTKKGRTMVIFVLEKIIEDLATFDGQ